MVGWLALLLATPLALFVVGRRGGGFENRRLTALPALSVGAVADGRYWHGAADYVLDRLPGRRQAVEARATLAYDVFSDTTNQRVVLGRAGWLFFRDELETCTTRAPAPAGALATLAGVRDLVAASGRSLVVAIAPDKLPVYADEAGRRLADERCAMARDRDLRARVAGAAAPWLPDLFGRLASARSGGDVYYRTDTHWDDRGRVVAIQALVDAIRPGVAAAADAVTTGVDHHQGDLFLLLGLDRTEDQPRIEIRRDVTSVQTEGLGRPAGTTVRRFRVAGRAPVVEQPTVLIADSQGFNATEFIRPYFRDITFCHWRIVRSAACAAALRRSRLIVVESVERDLYRRVGPFAGVVAAALAP